MLQTIYRQQLVFIKIALLKKPKVMLKGLTTIVCSTQFCGNVVENRKAKIATQQLAFHSEVKVRGHCDLSTAFNSTQIVNEQ